MKRKSGDIAETEPVKPGKEKKRKKHRHHPHRTENENENENGGVLLREDSLNKTSSRKAITKSDNEVSLKNQFKSRLEQLEKITQEIASAPKSIREHICEGGGEEIISAAAELARAFARAELSSEKSEECKQQENTSSPLDAPPIKDATLEATVFTHQGTIHEQNPAAGHGSYDRLEILGDAYLEVIATRLIWDRFPTLPAGRLSQIRELLVKNETLAQLSEQFGFDKRVKVAPDIRDHPKRWIKVKGDVFEAYIAAVILSNPLNGFYLVEDWLTQLWNRKLSSVQLEDQAVHYKELLAKKVMGRGIKLRYINESPPIRRKGGMESFFIGVYLTGWGWQDQHLGSGTGLNKVVAGNAAAKQALDNHPLIDKIHATKKAFDEKVKAEREKVLFNG
ncbi:ribonuclease III [Emydomyces testavorans]|uniref:Ribonuclease III n=1 Tax=Emydomyces testavorans TaxID=2070801 RepID=A0AAF0DEI7_9EURO|nr:ribonuclease III [Emydomyces testavorans]